MNAIDLRELGDYPVSPGTSAAIKGIYEQRETIRQDWLINVRTIMRNVLDSVPTEEQGRLKADSCIPVINAEIDQIKSLVMELAPRINLRIYSPSYKSFLRVWPQARVKVPTTEKQKFNDKLERDILQAISSRDDLEATDCQLPHVTDATYITTHYPADLLSKKGYGELILVESFTGKLKRKDTWSTKLTGSSNPEVAALPFNRLTIQIFGDNATQFYSAPQKLKQNVLSLAKDGRWNSLSPDERVRFSIGQMKDHFGREYFTNLMRP